MTFAMRPYRDEGDYWAIRGFLRETLLDNGGRMHSWHVNRLDYWKHHVSVNCALGDLTENVFLWENEHGQLAAVLHPETPGQIFLQIAPEARTTEFEEEVIATAEERLGAERADGVFRIVLWVSERDTVRQEIVARRGFEKHELARTQDHSRSLLGSIPEPETPEGIILQSQGDDSDHPKRSLASWRAFHPDEPDDGTDPTGMWYERIQRAPLYRRDLDVVAVDERGDYAGFCTCWFDDVTRSAVLEPVGTIPAYRRRGLGRAMIMEALRRAQQLGAVTAYVGSEDPNACAFYEAIGLPVIDQYAAWTKILERASS